MTAAPAQQPPNSPTWSARLADWAARKSAVVLIGALLLTAALAVPFLTMAPTESASQEPAGEVFDARDEVQERFGGGEVTWFFIVEGRDGEILDRATLLALQERIEALQADPTYGPLLLPRTDPASGTTFQGVMGLTGPVEATLTGMGFDGIAGADDATVRAVASEIIDAQGPSELGLSTQAVRDDATGLWSAPALSMSVLVDGDQIPGRGNDAGFGTDTAVEEAGRDVRTLLRNTDALDVHGVAVDQALTGEEQGEAAGPFIGFTVLAIVLLVGAVFRSYWILAVVGGALVALLVWLQGIANLIGLKDDQILATVVPIAMIAFGVDYAFHALGRYREERVSEANHQRAVGRGLRGVIPAMVLALATGVVAFLSNAASGIESITQFGIAAAIALVCAFVVLGLVVPIAVAKIDERIGDRAPRFSRPLSILGGVGAAATAMAAVLFTVFLAPPVGLGLLAGYVLVFIILPVLLIGRLTEPAGGETRVVRAVGEGRLGDAMGKIVTAVAGRRAILLPVVALLSIFAGFYGVQVPASFDVEDFFAADTDFVIALEKLDEHVGTQSGEEAVILITGNLDEPEAQATIAAFADRLEGLDTDRLARASDGRVLVSREALAVLDGSASLTPGEAAQVVAPADDSGRMAARLSVGLLGSRAQENIEASRELLEPLVADLEEELAAQFPGSEATLTGTPIVRQASLEAVSRSLLVSVPIAVVLCLLVTWVFLRSLRYALVSLVPILFVIAWLYGFMYFAGFSLNLVTATIGAISIGVGIDFATHLTMRYREELAVSRTRIDALRAAVSGTGIALIGSTVSSVVGFIILAFAPMPMFASYGLLTAVMISLALLSSLLVLPGLLLLVTREPEIVLPPAEALAAAAGSTGATGATGVGSGARGRRSSRSVH